MPNGMTIMTVQSYRFFALVEAHDTHSRLVFLVFDDLSNTFSSTSGQTQVVDCLRADVHRWMPWSDCGFIGLLWPHLYRISTRVHMVPMLM